MKIGIIGAGKIGGTLAKLWTAEGHEVCVSSRRPEQIDAPDGVRAVSIESAAEFGDAVLLAVPFTAPQNFSETVKEQLAGKVVIDANNAIPRRDGDDAQAVLNDGEGSGTWTANQLPGARVVKAFNTVHFGVMLDPPDGGPVAVPLASDDQEALDVVAGLVRDAGMEPVVVGTLQDSARFDFGTEVWNTSATATELRKALGVPETH